MKKTIPVLKRSTRDREYNSNNQNDRDKVVYAYLFKGKSHRKIDEEILNKDPAESRGWQAMGILHYLGLTNEFKGIFSKMNIDDAIKSLKELNEKDYADIIEVLKRIKLKSLDSNIVEKKNWLMFADFNIYNYDSSFVSRGYCHCVQNANYKDGDYIFIYCTAPYDRILYKTIVKKTNVVFDKILDDKAFWIDQTEYEKVKNGYFCRVDLISIVNSEELSLPYLLKNGLEKVSKEAIVLTDRLFHYINTRFLNVYPDLLVDISNAENMMEGQKMLVTVDRYERNTVARNRCIKENGCYCHVCNLDFEKTYGELGKGFIHVHHKKPLSETEGEHVVDYKNDLIPLCPNCHAMIHRKLNGSFVSVEQLKKIVAYYKELNRNNG